MTGIMKKLFKGRYIRSQFADIYGLAQEGRVDDALGRCEDLLHEFPTDAGIINEKGNLCAKYLGRGRQAHELYCRAVEVGGYHQAALINATDYSPNATEFRRISSISLKRVIDNRFRERIRAILQRLDKHEPYGALLAANAHKQSGLRHYGFAAAFAELLLDLAELPEEDEVRMRRTRAQYLRELDLSAASAFSGRGEHFSPAGRLALKEALEELERALALDEYDHELWNLKAAWCALLGRPEESLQFAERSLENAPADYVKPYVNKAIALAELGRDSDARQCLADASSKVDDPDTHPDIVQLRSNIGRLDNG